MKLSQTFFAIIILLSLDMSSIFGQEIMDEIVFDEYETSTD